MTDAERKAREVKKQSRPLVLAVKRAVMAMDAEMAEPSTVERGQRMAKNRQVLEQSDFSGRMLWPRWFRESRHENRRTGTGVLAVLGKLVLWTKNIPLWDIILLKTLGSLTRAGSLVLFLAQKPGQAACVPESLQAWPAAC
jgi:hypothetical protein